MFLKMVALRSLNFHTVYFTEYIHRNATPVGSIEQYMPVASVLSVGPLNIFFSTFSKSSRSFYFIGKTSTTNQFILYTTDYNVTGLKSCSLKNSSH